MSIATHAATLEHDDSHATSFSSSSIHPRLPPSTTSSATSSTSSYELHPKLDQWKSAVRHLKDLTSAATLSPADHAALDKRFKNWKRICDNLSEQKLQRWLTYSQVQKSQAKQSSLDDSLDFDSDADSDNDENNQNKENQEDRRQARAHQDVASKPALSKPCPSGFIRDQHHHEIRIPMQQKSSMQLPLQKAEPSSYRPAAKISSAGTAAAATARLCPSSARTERNVRAINARFGNVSFPSFLVSLTTDPTWLKSQHLPPVLHCEFSTKISEQQRQESIARLFRRAMLLIHSDRVMQESMEVQEICCELVKMLNAKHSLHKLQMSRANRL